MVATAGRRAALLLIATAALGCGAKGTARPERQVFQAFGHEWQVLGGVWEPRDGGVVGQGGVLQSIDAFGNGVIDVDVELLEGPPDRDLGVGFRYGAAGGDMNKGSGYGFNFNFNRAQRLVKGQLGQWSTLAATPEIVPGLADRLNHVRVVMKGADFELSVNGQAPVHFTDAMTPVGTISFWVEGLAQRVRFANFKFTLLDKR
jgi:hypothetical protein